MMKTSAVANIIHILLAVNSAVAAASAASAVAVATSNNKTSDNKDRLFVPESTSGPEIKLVNKVSINVNN
jgi:hypothetical protein